MWPSVKLFLVYILNMVKQQMEQIPPALCVEASCHQCENSRQKRSPTGPKLPLKCELFRYSGYALSLIDLLCVH